MSHEDLPDYVRWRVVPDEGTGCWIDRYHRGDRHSCVYDEDGVYTNVRGLVWRLSGRDEQLSRVTRSCRNHRCVNPEHGEVQAEKPPSRRFFIKSFPFAFAAELRLIRERLEEAGFREDPTTSGIIRVNRFRVLKRSRRVDLRLPAYPHKRPHGPLW